MCKFSHCLKEVSEKLRGSTEYELFGLTEHIGNIRSGHYIAFVKRHSDWMMFNDNRVDNVTEREVSQR